MQQETNARNKTHVDSCNYFTFINKNYINLHLISIRYWKCIELGAAPDYKTSSFETGLTELKQIYVNWNTKREQAWLLKNKKGSYCKSVDKFLYDNKDKIGWGLKQCLANQKLMNLLQKTNLA